MIRGHGLASTIDHSSFDRSIRPGRIFIFSESDRKEAKKRDGRSGSIFFGVQSGGVEVGMVLSERKEKEIAEAWRGVLSRPDSPERKERDGSDGWGGNRVRCPGLVR